MKNIMSSRKIILLFFVFFGLIILSGCIEKEAINSCLKGHTFGFLGGLLHGFLAPFNLIGMLFWNNTTVYAENNNGFLYALGFIIGSGGWGFLGGRGVSKRRNR
jgi:hypothetical protein